MMTILDLLVEVYEDEIKKLGQYSDVPWEEPREGFEKEFQQCWEKLQILEQMINEIPMDHIVAGKETGSSIQKFIGMVEGAPELYVNVKDFNHKFFYINMIIKNWGEGEVYKNKRLLRLSYKIWFEWFLGANGSRSKYEVEKQQRIDKNLSTNLDATLINGEIRRLKWHTDR